PRRGYLGDAPWRKPRQVRQPHGWFPVTPLPRGLAPALPAPVPPQAPPRVARWPRGSVADLVDEAARREVTMRAEMARRAELARRARAAAQPRLSSGAPAQVLPPPQVLPPQGGGPAA